MKVGDLILVLDRIEVLHTELGYFKKKLRDGVLAPSTSLQKLSPNDRAKLKAQIKTRETELDRLLSKKL